jgi:O-Antigen ligase
MIVREPTATATGGNLAQRRPRHLSRSAGSAGSLHVLGLRLFAFTLFLFPSDVVLRVIGAQGYVAGLVAFALLAAWLSSTVLGLHATESAHHTTRALIAAFAATSLVSWSLTAGPDLTAAERLSADRWILLIAASAGVALVAAEGLRSMEDVRRVLRALVAGGAFCGLVAALQYWAHVDLTTVLDHALPGFEVNSTYTSYQTRGALSRVTGTAQHPIELGVVAGMMLPLAVTMALYDRRRPAWLRWLPVALIGLSVPMSVSRSGVLAVLVACGVFVLLLPHRQRVVGIALTPVAVVAVFMLTPGYLSTLASYVGAGASDLSVSTRLGDYPLVERLVSQHPWFGSGGGTYFADNSLDILDNQYLKSAIELGIVVTLGLMVYLLAPILVAVMARGRSRDPELRTLLGALAGAAAAGAVSSATFDSFSFNTYVGLYSLVVGLTGACWLISHRAAGVAGETHHGPPESARDAPAQVACQSPWKTESHRTRN